MSIVVNDLTEEISQRLGPFAPLVNIPSVAAWAMREIGFSTASARTVTDADFIPVTDDDIDELFDFTQYGAAERVFENLDPVQLKSIGIDEPVADLRKVWRERIGNLHDKLQKKYNYGLPTVRTGSLRLPDSGDCRAPLGGSPPMAAAMTGPPAFGFTVGFGTGSDSDRLQIDGLATGPHLTGPAGPRGDKGDKGDKGDLGSQGPPGPPGSGSGSGSGFDVSAYGADPLAADNTAAIQTAADAASAAQKAMVAAGHLSPTVRLTAPPGACYYCKSPVWLAPGVGADGLNVQTETGSTFILGLPRPSRLGLDPARFRPLVDSFMDGSVIGWRGFYPDGNAALMFPCSPFQVGTHPPAARVTPNFGPGGTIPTFNVVDPGGRYYGTPPVTIAGSGSGATAHAVLDADGFLTAVVSDTPGVGYATDATVTLPDPLGGLVPDYYADTAVLTVELMVKFDPGYVWTNLDIIAGLKDLYGYPDPWILGTAYKTNSPQFTLLIKGDDFTHAGSYRAAQVTVADGTLGIYRVVIQYDTRTGLAATWANQTTNGRPVRVQDTYTWGGNVPAPGPAAGHRIAAHPKPGDNIAVASGRTPLVIGSLTSSPPNIGGTPLPATVCGLRVTRGALYDTTGGLGSPLVFSDPSLLGQTPTDAMMFARFVLSPTARTISGLDLSCPAGDTVLAYTSQGANYGLVLVREQPNDGPGGNYFDNCSLQSATEAAILYAGVFGAGLHVTECNLYGGLRGISSIGSTGYSQPVTIEKSTLNGYDCAVFASTTFLTMRSCMSNAGREGFRLDGGEHLFVDTWIGTAAANFAWGWRFLDNAYGSNAEFMAAGVDNENQPPIAAIVEYQMPQAFGSALLITHSLICATFGDADFISLIAYPANNNTGYVSIKGLNNVTDLGEVNQSGHSLRATGGPVWHGELDGRALVVTRTTGDGLDKIEIKTRA